MSLRRFMCVSMVLALALGCDDAASGSDPALDQGPLNDAVPADAAPDQGAREDQGIPSLDANLPPAGEPAYVEVTLEPRKPLYTLSEHPQAKVRVLDSHGDALSGVPLTLSAPPRVEADGSRVEVATLDAAGTLSFLAEGQGAVKACVRPDLCGRASFFVDDGAATLVVESPERGAFVTGEAPQIEVRGYTDPIGEDCVPRPGVPVLETCTRVFVNDHPIDVTAEGRFVHYVDAQFGLNRLDIVADDGVRRPPSRVVMEVVYAPAVLPADATGIDLAEALVIRLDQALLDQGQALPGAMDGQLTVTDLAGLVELFLSQVDPMGLVAPDQPELSLVDSPQINLRVVAVKPGRPDVTLRLTEEGLEVFLRLSDLTVTTRGRLDLNGTEIDLGLDLMLTASAYAVLSIESDSTGKILLDLPNAESIGIAIEGIRASGGDTTALALINTLGSVLREPIERFATDLIDQYLSERVPEFIELSIGDILDPLSHLPIDLILGEGLPELHFDLGFTLSEPRFYAQDRIELSLSGRFDQRGEVVAPHDDPGVPVESLDAPPPWPAAAGLALAVRLAAVNAMVHEVWRQGALTIDVSPLLPAQLSALIRGARVDARLAPLVVGTRPGSPYRFEVQVGELDLFTTSGTGQVDHYVLSLRAGLTLEVDGAGIRFNVADSADIRVALLESGGARPLLQPEALAGLLEPLIWGQVKEALAGGLNLPIPAIQVGPELYAPYAPSILELAFSPTFPEPPAVRHGWFILPAGLSSTARLAQ